jgi:uridine kinase
MTPATNRAARLDELAAMIAGVRRAHPTRVAIDGVDGSGKTTLADELVEPLRRAGREVIRASVDGFHNPRAVRYARGRDSPEGYFLDSFDFAAVRRELLEPLGATGDRKYRTAVFDYRVDRPVEVPARVALVNAVLLFDGVFLQRPELHGLWDLSVWVDVPFEITVARAVARDAARGGTDAAAVRSQYDRRYVPGQRLYMSQCRPHERADVVFGNADLERPTMKSSTRGAESA